MLVLVRFNLKGVREVQSPPWRRNESKSAAPGIYTVGQFANGAYTGGALPAIIIHKDKTAQVAIGRLKRLSTHLEQ